MKTVSFIKYQIEDSLKSIGTFYFVIGILLVLSTISRSLLNGNVIVSGLEFATAIFVFVAGIASYREDLRFGSVNGLSRKTMFVGLAAGAIPFALIMASIDTVIRLVFGSFGHYKTMFMQMYGDRFIAGSSLLSYLEGFIWMTLLYILIRTIGALISLVYYRSGKKLKLLISLSPAIFLALAPMFNNLLSGNLINKMIVFFLRFWGLYQTVNPLIFVGYASITTLITLSLIYLLMRKTPIR